MKNIITIIATFLCTIGAYAQYFNTPFYKMGFDSKQELSTWTINTEQAPTLESDLWNLDPEENSFNEIDPSSQGSLSFSIKSDEVCVTTITSPVIPASDKKGLVVGFSGTKLRLLSAWMKCFLYFEASSDGQKWTRLFDSSTDNYSGISLNIDWYYYYYYLPAEFNNKDLQLRFRVDASEYGGWGTSFALDGVFVSQRHEFDAGISYLNQMIQGDNFRGEALKDIFLEKESVKIKFFNNGLNDIKVIDLCYQVDGQEKVVEPLTLDQPLKTGDTLKYTFKEKADFTQPMKTYTIKTWVNFANEQNCSNDSLTGNVENILAAAPYEPTFSFYNNMGTYIITDDHWTYEVDPTSNTGWRYTQGREESYVHWDIDFSRAQTDCNTYLISRPIYFEGGKSYDLYFDIETQLTSADKNKKNKVTIYYTTDKNGKEGLTEIWKNEAIDSSNGLNSEARMTPASNGIYYMVFLCTSPRTADKLSLHHISVLETILYDVKAVKVLQPEKVKLLYSEKETVKVKLNNHGMQDITEEFNIYMAVDGQQIAAETVKQTIAKGADIEHTFNTKADLSDASKTHTLTVWTSYAKDTRFKNDTVSQIMINKATAIPYHTEYSTDESYWEKIDNNKDGKTFVAVKTSEWSDAMCLEYSGSTGTTDEYLYSRPLQLHAGKIYRATYRVNIQSPESGSTDIYEYNLNVSLYKITQEGKQLVIQLDESAIKNYNTLQSIFRIEENGIYTIGYHVTYDKPTNYFIRFAEFDIIETAEYDISLTEVLIPGTQISAYQTIPVGVKVYNNGINPVTEFTVEVSSPTIGKKTQTFTQTIESQKSTTVYLEEITFTHTSNEDLAVKVSTENDNVPANNSQTISISRLENIDIPANIPFRKDNGWLSINRNQDNRYFEPGNEEYTIYLTAEGETDWLVSRSMNLKSGKVYKVSFDYVADDNYNSLPKFKVYAFNCDTRESTVLTTVVSNKGVTHWGSQCTYTGYMEVPADGVYSIIFEDQKDIEDNYNDITLKNQLTVEEVSEKPDLKLIAITEPMEDKILTEEEKITVLFKNEGTLPLNSVSFVCHVNDVPHYICYQEELAAGAEATVTFENVNLNVPGDYTLVVKAELYTDKNMEDNTLTKTIKSLPIIEMQTLSLDSPKNGKLGTEEAVIITLQNNGKGAATQVPVHYSIVHAESKAIIEANEIIEASIAEGETYQYTFNKKANMSKDGIYTVTVYVDMENETDVHNDTLKVNIVGTHKDMDAGVVEITAPKKGLLSHEETVSIKVKNFGEDILFSVPVQASVTKGDDTIAELMGNIAEIKAGESIEYTFEQKADMYMTGDYTITAKTLLETDVNPANDECTATVHADKVDCGVTEIISPATNCTAGEQEITVMVKNFGDVEVKDIPIFFKVGTMPQTGMVKETIPVGESVTYTFSTKYNFRVDREYTLTVYTELEGDMNAENNSCKKTIKPTPNGIDKVNIIASSLYPNPAKEYVTVIVTDDILHSIVVYDTIGKARKRFDRIMESEYSFSVQGYTKGVYYVKIETDKRRTVHKLLVE